MTSAKKISFKKGLVIILSAFLIFTTLSMVATKLVYDNIFARYEAESVAYPAELAPMVTGREKKTYPAGENQLVGYLYTANSTVAKDGLIVIAPGFHAGTEQYLWQIKSLLDYGWSVFIFDMTGSGASEGDSAVGFAQAIRDMEATLTFLEQNDRFGYTDLFLLGHSRGGYAACCCLQAEYDIAAVVSISGVNSAMEGVMGSSVEAVGPIAYGNYGFLWLYQAMLFGPELLGRSADKAISQSETPVLIVHGQADEDVPIDRFSIISHREEIDSDWVKYLICTEPEQDGHTNLLFEKDGTANQALMAQIHAFLSNRK